MYHQWPENPKTSPVPIKRDQPRERDEQKSVGKDRRDEKGAARTYERKKWRGPFFGRIYRYPMYVYVCPWIRTAKSPEFHFCPPAEEHYRSFCRRCEGFWFRTSAARSEFLPFLGRKPSSGIWGNGVLNWSGRIVGRYKWWHRRKKKGDVRTH